MKTFSAMLILAAVLAFSSCKNAEDKKPVVAATPDTPAAAAVVPPPPPAFIPFKLLSVSHTVKNFEAWKKMYDGDDSTRTANGLSKFVVARDMTSPNKVYVLNKIADTAKAKAFAMSPTLKKLMAKAGVIGAPTIAYSEVVKLEETPAEFKDRLRVTVKIKDFDAWMKVFDSEGKATRAAHGLIDRAISRDLNDPNTISVTFAISDMAKAKARTIDPELKKLMTESGVISAPIFTWYTVVN